MTFLSLSSFHLPIKEELPGSKLRGAISFQSKSNELPQSTTQVLINIRAFAFKSSPIYRSIPFHLGNIESPVEERGGSPLSGGCRILPLPASEHERLLHKVNIESALVVKFLVLHIVTDFLIHRPRALSKHQIFGDLVCTIMDRRPARRRPRSSLDQCTINHRSGQMEGVEKRQTRAPATQLLLNGSTSEVQPDSLIAFHTAPAARSQHRLISAETSANRIRPD